MVCDLLASLGFQTKEARRPSEAIRSVSKSADRIDILMTDIQMPEMDGLELARQIAALQPGIRVIYMSGGITEEEWRDAPGLLKGSHFLPKPFRIDQLRGVISRFSSKPRRQAKEP